MKREIAGRHNAVGAFFSSAIAGIFVASTAIATQAADVPLSQDAEVRASQPDTKFGGRNSLRVRDTPLSQTLLQFDLSNFSGTVVNATLSLYVNRVFKEGSIQVRPVLNSWAEGTVDFSTQPSLSSQVSATKEVFVSDEASRVEVDVTSLVQAHIDDPVNNFGFALVPVGLVHVTLIAGERFNGPTMTVELDGPPPLDPVIIENVFAGEDSLAISGQNFDNGAAPTVSLSGIGTLTVSDSSATMITATFAAGSIPNGDYLLTVSTGSESGQTGAYNLTVGAVGNQGPPGPQGPVGPAGPQGLQGDTGPQGAPGMPGADGAPGPIGPEGSAGATGAQGLQGDTGAQGVPGAIGPEGSMGPPGLPGIQGEAGPVGPEGSVGATGPQGPQGVAGDPGADGVSGLVNRLSCSQTITLEAGGQYGWAVACPAGKKATGGGGYVAPGQSPIALTQSYLFENTNLGLDVWTASFWNSSSLSVSTRVCAQAICAEVAEED